MIRTVRKNRSFEQKQKRPCSARKALSNEMTPCQRRERKKQDMISANTNDDDLRKDYEMVKKKGRVTHD